MVWHRDAGASGILGCDGRSLVRFGRFAGRWATCGGIKPRLPRPGEVGGHALERATVHELPLSKNAWPATGRFGRVFDCADSLTEQYPKLSLSFTLSMAQKTGRLPPRGALQGQFRFRTGSVVGHRSWRRQLRFVRCAFRIAQLHRFL